MADDDNDLAAACYAFFSTHVTCCSELNAALTAYGARALAYQDVQTQRQILAMHSALNVYSKAVLASIGVLLSPPARTKPAVVISGRVSKRKRGARTRQ
jgi:hypothetical protein